MSTIKTEFTMTIKEYFMINGIACGLIFFYLFAFLLLFPYSIYYIILNSIIGAAACLFLVLLLISALRMPKTKARLPSITKLVKSWPADLGIGLILLLISVGYLLTDGVNLFQSADNLVGGSVFVFFGVANFIIKTRINKRTVTTHSI